MFSETEISTKDSTSCRAKVAKHYVMNTYAIDGQKCDSVELKCFAVSRGLKADKEMYKTFSPTCRFSPDPMQCNCFRLSDGTIVQLTDMSFHLRNLKGMLSWDTLKLMKYSKDLVTDFALEVRDDKAALTYKNEFVDYVTFPPKKRLLPTENI